MPIAFVVIFAPGFYTMYLYVSSLRCEYLDTSYPVICSYSVLDILSPIRSTRGCTVVAAREIVIWSWVSLLVWNTGAFLSIGLLSTLTEIDLVTSVTLVLTVAHNLRIR